MYYYVYMMKEATGDFKNNLFLNGMSPFTHVSICRLFLLLLRLKCVQL